MPIRSRIAGFGLASVLALSVMTAAPARAAEPSADTVVATVNGAPITLGQMIALRDSLPKDYLALPDDVLFNGILEQIVQQTALAAEGEAKMTKRDELVLQNQRLGYLAGLVLDDTASAAVTDEAVKAAYDAQYSGAQLGKEYNASHILVETEDEAKAIKAEIDAGADFAAVAQEKSTGPSGGNGGDLGWFSAGMMVQPFEDAVMKLEPGQVSDPVQTQFGWHIVKLNEVRDAQPPSLEEAHDDLAADLQQKAVEDKVTKLMESADVVRSTDGIDPAVLKDTSIIGE